MSTLNHSPRLIVPAIYLTHLPYLRRRVRVSRVNDAIHVQFRFRRFW